MDVANRRGGVARVLRRRVLVGRIDDVDQVVRNAAPLGQRHLVGADVEAAIDRRRVAVDDLAAEPLGQRQRQRALAGRGRPEHRDDKGLTTRHTPQDRFDHHAAKQQRRTHEDVRDEATNAEAELLAAAARIRDERRAARSGRES